MLYSTRKQTTGLCGEGTLNNHLEGQDFELGRAGLLDKNLRGVRALEM